MERVVIFSERVYCNTENSIYVKLSHQYDCDDGLIMKQELCERKWSILSEAVSLLLITIIT